MRLPNGDNGDGERRQLISSELRQLHKMSKGLRTKALRTLMERAAARRKLAEAAVSAPKAVNPPIARPKASIAA